MKRSVCFLLAFVALPLLAQVTSQPADLGRPWDSFKVPGNRKPAVTPAHKLREHSRFKWN